jgi:hypothetical protein
MYEKYATCTKHNSVYIVHLGNQWQCSYVSKFHMKVDQFLHIVLRPNLVFYISVFGKFQNSRSIGSPIFEKQIHLSHKIIDGHSQ